MSTEPEIPGSGSNQWRIAGSDFGEQRRLDELDRRLSQVYMRDIYPREIGAAQISAGEYPRIFHECGLTGIGVSGYLSTFSFSDPRYSGEEMADYLVFVHEYEVKVARRYFEKCRPERPWPDNPGRGLQPAGLGN